MTQRGCKLSFRWRRISAILLSLGMIALMITLAGCGVEVEETPTPTLIRTPRPTFTPVPTETPAPTEAPPTPTVTPTRREDVSPLTGMEADPELVMRRVLAVRIGNDPPIRPQEGLGVADLVYEEIMDGWAVTRFTALFLESDAERVRPIRSARLVNLSIIPQYDAALVHTGASDPIRFLISQADFVDLDEYFNPQPYAILSGYDWRGRVYTSTDALHAYLERADLQQDRLIEGYLFDAVPPIGEPAQSIHIPYPRSSIVDWTYDEDAGHYLREVQGVPHTEALTGEQIAADNVIVFYTEHRATDIIEDSLGSTAIDIVMSGSGPAIICRDGVMIEAEWRSTGLELILYYDEDGEEIPLRPGKTWIQLVPLDYQVTFD